MNVVALIIWFSAAAAGLPLLAAGLIEYAGGFRDAAATCLPASVIFARAVPPLADPGARRGMVR